MNWYNLKKNKCPECNRDFMLGLTMESNMQPTTMRHKCGFTITEQRYKEIVSNMVSRDLEGRLSTEEIDKE